MNEDYQIIHADCLEYMKSLPDKSVDLVLTDPPYEIGADKDSLKAEIKFLRETVEKLADKATIKTVIQEIIPRYISYPIYQPYYYWSGGISTYCGGSAINTLGAGTNGLACQAYSNNATQAGSNNTYTLSASSGNLYAAIDGNFTEIQTF